MSEDRLPGLHWGIKASFLEYIARMSDGRGTVTDGATVTEGNVMVFEPAPQVVAPPSIDADRFHAFRGDVRFAGHFGMLFVRIADPWITVRGDEAEMTVLDPFKPDEEPRLPLVHFTLHKQALDEDLDAWLSTDVRLSDKGTGLFNDVYQPGELFDPLAVFLPTAIRAR